MRELPHHLSHGGIFPPLPLSWLLKKKYVAKDHAGTRHGKPNLRFVICKNQGKKNTECNLLSAGSGREIDHLGIQFYMQRASCCVQCMGVVGGVGGDTLIRGQDHPVLPQSPLLLHQ